MIDDWQILLIRTCYIIEVSTTFSTSPIVRQLRLEDATMELNRLKELMKKQDYKNKKKCSNEEKKKHLPTNNTPKTNKPTTNK